MQTGRVVGQVEGHGVDRKIPPGQVLFDGIPVFDRRAAAVKRVNLGAIGGDLIPIVVFSGADGAEPLPHRVQVVRPAPKQGFDMRGTGGGGEVKIGGVPLLQQGVAHRPAHQVDFIPGGGEQPAQLASGSLGEPSETLGDHMGSRFRCGIGRGDIAPVSTVIARRVAVPGSPPDHWARLRPRGPHPC